MPMKACVTRAGGRIISEVRDGTYRRFDHDIQGNVVALRDEAGNVTDTYEYGPFGELRSSTGTTKNPWKYGGAWGYYTDANGRQHVGARTLRNDLGRWMTVDPLWPLQPPYVYASNNPVSRFDPSGLSDTPFTTGEPYGCPPDTVNEANQCCDRFSKLTPAQVDGIKKCVEKTWPGSGDVVGKILDRLKSMCKGKGQVMLKCYPPEPPPGGFPAGCHLNCLARGALAANFGSTFPAILPTPAPGEVPSPAFGCIVRDNVTPCSTYQGQTKCLVVLCPSHDATDAKERCKTYLHELVHCVSGLRHIRTDVQKDIVFDIERCIAEGSS